MAKPKWRKGIPLDDNLLAQLRAFVHERGVEQTAKLFDLGQISIVRAIGGLGLRRGTVFVIKTKLLDLSAMVEDNR
jgi:hypothetical protein